MRTQRGLGLLELLVALVLVSLAAALVMQGVGQGLGMLRRVAADQGVVYHELMARAWLRESVAAAAGKVAGSGEIPEEDETSDVPVDRPAAPPPTVFAGTAAALEMQSFRPLLGAEGIATTIRWSADAQQGLRYEEGDQQVLVDALPPLQRIEYEGPDGVWQPQWPPADALRGGASTPTSVLPVRVRFEFADDDRVDVLLLARRNADTGEDDMEAQDE